MSQLEDFESTLKDVVQAKRLSASKMTKLKELATKLMTDDTQLVSILYRTHKSLSAQAKVSSLYVFDALARDAKAQANKQNLVGDVSASKGNCATFLLKVEGVLEGLFQDMVLVGTPEAKEKTKKILDIWVKGNTFPSAVLSRLTDVLKSKDTVKESVPKPVASSTVVSFDPRVAAQPLTTSPLATPTPPIPAAHASILPQVHAPSTPLESQSTILALLTQAVHAGAATTSNKPTPNPPVSIPATGPKLDVAQLALLQQLTQTAQLGSNMSYPIASVSADVNVIRPPYGDESSGYSSLSGDHNRYSSPDDDYRHDGRGGSRGYRGNRGGRWNEGRGKRDGRDQFRDRDRMAKRSRSKSPPSRYGASRREIKPYSPPRKPPMAAVRETLNMGESQPSAGNAEKDEFGRDIRATSESPKEVVDPPVRTPGEVLKHPNNGPAQPSRPPPSSSPATAPSPSPSSSTFSGTESKLPGLEQFNVSTFNFTSPAAWETLGKMWLASYGTMPTTEQLMQFVMFAGTSVDPSQMMSADSWDQSSWDSAGSSYIDAAQSELQGGYGGRWNQGGPSTNGDWSNDRGGSPKGMKDAASEPVALDENRDVGGGHMQKVGDKWIFVRGGDSAVS